MSEDKYESFCNEIQELVTIFIADKDNETELGELLLDHSESYWERSFDSGLTPQQALKELIESLPENLKSFRAYKKGIENFKPPAKLYAFWPTGDMGHETIVAANSVSEARRILEIVFDASLDKITKEQIEMGFIEDGGEISVIEHKIVRGLAYNADNGAGVPDFFLAVAEDPPHE